MTDRGVCSGGFDIKFAGCRSGKNIMVPARFLLLGSLYLSKIQGDPPMSGITARDMPTSEMTTPLAEASIQDIQLELIRRRQFNAFDGQRVVDCLRQHRELWEAVMMDRLAISHPGTLPTLGLMKLRDLPQDDWNVDTLYILTPRREDAERIAEIFNMRQWGGMVDVHTQWEEVDSALGGAKPGQAVVAIWWD